MRVLPRTVCCAAVAAVLGSGLVGCSAGTTGESPVNTTSGSLAPGVVQLITPEILAPVNARYVRSDDAVYPPSVAVRLASGTRVLITDGTADTNVPVSTIRPLAAALTAAGATGPGLRVLAGVNHVLHLPGVSDNTQALAPPAVAALQEWANPFAAAPAS
jgi:uncharacterized protein